jgi:hypothetical protein
MPEQVRIFFSSEHAGGVYLTGDPDQPANRVLPDDGAYSRNFCSGENLFVVTRSPPLAPPDSKNPLDSSRVSSLMRFDKRDFLNPSASFLRNQASPLGVLRVNRPEAEEECAAFFDRGAQLG